MFQVPAFTTRATPDGCLVEVLKGSAIRFDYEDGHSRLGWVHAVNRTRNFATVVTVHSVFGYRNYSLHKMDNIQKVM